MSIESAPMNPAHGSSANKQTKMPNLFYFKREKVLRRKGEAQKKKKEKKRSPASLCSRVYTVGAVWAQRDSKLGTEVARVS